MIINSEDYGKVNVPDALIDDIAAFYSLSIDEVVARLSTYQRSERADIWLRDSPQTPEEILRFYERYDCYIWQLTLFNCSPLYDCHLESLKFALTQVSSVNSKYALDYGCGIGTAALITAGHGYHVTLADIPGPTFEFAKLRLERRNISYDSMPVTGEGIRFTHLYDLIIAIDVLEHIPRPDYTLRRLTSSLRSGGIAQMSTAFLCQDGDHPDHIAGHDDRFTPQLWELETSAAGLDQIGTFVYRKVGQKTLSLRRLRYEFWRRTGFYVMKIARPTNLD
jgi:2-polyprenyl-3-methyl-5-hydroxy-6-metoxy-1,4-benzoquinol methylase